MSGTGAPRMVLVRHGETAWSASGQHTGRTDIPLEPAGQAEAKALAPVLAGHDFAQVLTSPLRRASATAALAGFAERAVVCDDLLEWDYGDAEGRTTDDVRAERPGWTLFGDGVTGGETAADVGRRADRVIDAAHGASGDTLCFAHGHLLRVLAARWVGLPPAGGRLFVLDAASVSVLGWEREVRVVAQWNGRDLPGR
jgi:probable phosphoglycerate mutase